MKLSTCERSRCSRSQAAECTFVALFCPLPDRPRPAVPSDQLSRPHVARQKLVESAETLHDLHLCGVAFPLLSCDDGLTIRKILAWERVGTMHADFSVAAYREVARER